MLEVKRVILAGGYDTSGSRRKSLMKNDSNNSNYRRDSLKPLSSTKMTDNAKICYY